MREFDRGTIPGSDIEMSGYQHYSPLPNKNDEVEDAGEDPNPWLRKTDWALDSIIANGQQ